MGTATRINGGRGFATGVGSPNPGDEKMGRESNQMVKGNEMITRTVDDACGGEPKDMTVEVESAGLSIIVPGYGTAAMVGDSPVVLIEYREGVPFVVVWADITDEEPTHVISLADAVLSHQLPE